MRLVLVFVFSALVLSAAPPPVLAQGPPGGPPSRAAAQTESTFEGELDVVYEDTINGSRLLHFLQVAGRRLALRFDGHLPPGLATGSRVRVRGRLTDNTLELSAGGQSVEALALSSATTFGEQRTLVMLVNFQDNTSQPYSVASAASVTFQDVNDFMYENSYQQTWFTGDVVGWITLPMTSGTCDYSRIASLAEQAAANQGISLSQYRRRIFAFPQTSACGWWGLGNVGGNPSRSWINGSYALKVVAHELGHNLGLYHSRSASCDAAGCTTSEYGDTHDVMGSPTGHLNAFQKHRAGWLGYGISPPVQTVTTSGTYWIDAMAPPGSAPKALRVLKGIDANGYRTWYYVEARARAGFDRDVLAGVIVHTGSEATGNSSLQIDMTPTGPGFDAVLDPGQAFTDPAAGITISTTGVTSAGASVFIDYGGAPCTTRAPEVSLSPATTLVAEGQTATLTLTVRNQDDASCQAAEFLVAAAVPAGWGVSSGASRLLVAPGVTGSTSVTISPGTGTAVVTAAVSRSTGTGPGGSASASVVVASALTVTLSVSAAKGGIQATAAVLTGGVPLSGATATFTVTSPTGQVRTYPAVSDSRGMATVKWKPHPRDPRGTYQVSVTVSSGTLVGSAGSSYVW